MQKQLHSVGNMNIVNFSFQNMSLFVIYKYIIYNVPEITVLNSGPIISVILKSITVILQQKGG